MDIRPNSIKDLYERLKNRESLKNKIFLFDDKLTIIFADHYKLDVKIGFYTYINGKYDFDFDDQDIIDVLIDISENNYYIMENKTIVVPEKGSAMFPNRKRFQYLDEDEYSKRKEKLMKMVNIKIFNHDKIIYES